MTDREAAFSAFFRSDYQSLLRAVIFTGGEPHEAEDALEDAMCVAYEKWESIESPHAYVRTVAIRKLIKTKDRKRREQSATSDGDGAESGETTGQEIWEQQEWVSSVLEQLPPAQRQVLTCVVEELKPAEIAVLLGKNPDAVRQNLSAARKRLKKYLAETSRAEIAATAHGRRADER
jgi:RNA polymerase sigma-70 factor (ECF subfamily)